MRALRLLLRRRRGQFRRAALWAMVPLAFGNGWPVLGCICADGSWSPNCPALRRHATKVTGEAYCCKAACCAAAKPDAAVKSCCQNAADSKRSQRDGETRSRINHQGCHIVVQSGELPTLPPLVQAADEQGIFASFGMSAWDPAIQLALHRATFVENDTGQHSLDLVITLRRLVI